MSFQSDEYRIVSDCVCCDSNRLVPLVDLKNQPLANSYKDSISDKQAEYPLKVMRCGNCNHLQLSHSVNPELMFNDYAYTSGVSQTMHDYAKWFARFVREYPLAKRTKATVLDIGCNDGTQLRYFKEISSYDYYTVGIDPAQNLASLAKPYCDIHYATYFASRTVGYRKFDIVIAQNVFAHNRKPYEFLMNIRNILSEGGLAFIQTSQADMILNNEYDTIYHEHFSFFNINSMRELARRVGINLIDVVKTTLHGNSFLFVLSNDHKRDYHIDNLIAMESRAGLHNEKTYAKYKENVELNIRHFREAVIAYKDAGYTIIGYGAAAKGMTVLNATEMNIDLISAIIDDSPRKQGKFTPGSSIPIVPMSELKNLVNENTNVLFIPLAWNFFDEIQSKILKFRKKNDEDLHYLDDYRCKSITFMKYFPKIELITE